MAAFNPKHLTNPDIVRTIETKRLLALIMPYADYVRLMALAIQYQEMLRTGEATDMIELARRAKVSQPRMSQIMALNLLAPDIQTALLYLPPQSKGNPFLHAKRIRPITAMLHWTEQRVAWQQILATKKAIGTRED